MLFFTPAASESICATVHPLSKAGSKTAFRSRTTFSKLKLFLSAGMQAEIFDLKEAVPLRLSVNSLLFPRKKSTQPIAASTIKPVYFLKNCMVFPFHNLLTYYISSGDILQLENVQIAECEFRIADLFDSDPNLGDPELRLFNSAIRNPRSAIIYVTTPP